MQELFTPYFILCLTLFTLPAQAQLSGAAVAGSLLQVVQVSKPDSSRVKLYLQLGKYYVNKVGEIQADMDSAYAYTKEAETLSLSLKYGKGYEESQLLLAYIFYESSRIDELKALLQKSKPDKIKANAMYLLGSFHLYKPLEIRADLDSAERNFKESLHLFLQLNDQLGQIKSLIKLGMTFNEKNEQEKASVYLRKAIPLIEQLNDLSQQAYYWNWLGEGYSRFGIEETKLEQIEYYERALALYRKIGNREQEASVLKTIADTHQMQGKFAQSLRELLEVVRIQKSIGSRSLHYTYDLLGHVHRLMGNYEHALPYALESIKQARTSGDTVHISLFYMGVV